MKRRKIGNPCFLCEKSLLDCDGNRPCSRCVAKNIPQMCLGIEISQLANQNYGGIKNEAKSTSFSQQKTTSIPPSNDSSQTKEIRTSNHYFFFSKKKMKSTKPIKKKRTNFK